MDEAAKHIDETVGKREEMERLKHTEISLIDYPRTCWGHLASSAPQRRLLCTGALTKVLRSGTKALQFWLLGDALLYGSEIREGLYKYHNYVPLEVGWPWVNSALLPL